MRIQEKRRILCFLLALGFMLSMGTVGVFALDSKPQASEIANVPNEASEKGAVARVERTGETYPTLQAAIDAAHTLITSGAHAAQTVTLLRNTAESVSRVWTKTSVDYDYTLTIDLNGHTVTGTDGSVMRFAAHGSGGAAYGFHVTVTDTSAAHTGTITGGTGTPTAHAGTSGGGIYFDGATVKDTLTVHRVNIVGNHVTGNGGAIAMGPRAAAHLAVTGCTIAGNTAANGGAIFGRWVTVQSGTITGNSAFISPDDSQSGVGGAIYMWGSGTQELTLGENARVYGNTAEYMGDDIAVASLKGRVTYDVRLSDPAKWEDGLPSDLPAAWYVDGYAGQYARDYAEHLARYDSDAPQTLESYTVTLKGRSAPAYLISVKLVGFTPKTEETVTVDPANGDAPYAVSLPYGDIIGDTVQAPIRAGYTFAGWIDENGRLIDTSQTYDGSFTKLTASWTANVYTITLNTNGGRVKTDTLTVTYDSPVGNLPIPTRIGYKFIAWKDADGHVYTSETLYKVQGDLTLFAQWQALSLFAPLTGAGSGIAFWCVLAACSVSLVSMLIYRERKRRRHAE